MFFIGGSGGLGSLLNCAPNLVATLAHLQLVVMCEGHEKTEGFGICFLEAAVDDHTLDAGRDNWFEVGRVINALVFAKQRHATAQALGPVAGTKGLTIAGNADNDDFQMWPGHDAILGSCG